MSFFEVEFPRNVRFGLAGGPSFSTTINAAYSGYEQRNQNWSQSLGKWTVDFQARPGSGDWERLHAFFLAVSGQADGFRLHWALDYATTDELIGIGDGETKDFQLVKSYAIGGRYYVRKITKPVTASATTFDGHTLPNTLKVYINGTLKTLTSDYTVSDTGLVSFVNPPGGSASITADFEFHYPVRFASDDFQPLIEESDISDPLITASSIQLVEVRL